MKGIIYILINEAMPGYIKIGKTTNTIEQRMRELYNTAVPLPFECFYAGLVEDINKVERALHDAFEDNRVSSGREFFEIAPERVFAVLNLLTIEDKTPTQDYVESKEDVVALNKARERRINFNFEMIKIPVGAKLIFSRDKNIICEVVDNRNVRYREEIMSLARAAYLVLEELGYNHKQVSGALYWKYEGETLDERRKRIEEEN